MRVVFMGTPQIAADCLSRLIADGFDLVGVYTKPDMPKNRGMNSKSLRAMRYPCFLNR